jgi:anti-sigma B factor antagonist
MELPVAEFRICAAVLDDEVHVVSVAGELDLHTAGELSAELDGAIARGPKRIVIDLGGVTFLDSTALGALVTAAKRARAAGAPTLVVVTDDPHTLKIFRITGLDAVLGLRRTLSEAVAEAAA